MPFNSLEINPWKLSAVLPGMFIALILVLFPLVVSGYEASQGDNQIIEPMNSVAFGS